MNFPEVLLVRGFFATFEALPPYQHSPTWPPYLLVVPFLSLLPSWQTPLTSAKREQLCWSGTLWSQTSTRSHYCEPVSSSYEVHQGPFPCLCPPCSGQLLGKPHQAPFSAWPLLRRSSLFLTSLAFPKRSFKALAPTVEVAFIMEAISGVGYSLYLNLSASNKQRLEFSNSKLKQKKV